MPEGHTLHRLARDIRRDLRGSVVRASSPQGRFTDSAARLDGHRLLGTEAYGKHLFLDWDTGDTLYVHLGLIGKFRRRPAPPPTPVGEIRLRLTGEPATWDLSGPMACRLVDPAARLDVLRGAGPDPLRRDGDPERFAAALARRSIPLGAALLDQSVISGVGNVYRAELCFLCGIRPIVPARDLRVEQVGALWRATVEMLTIGVRLDRIVTRVPAEVGVASAGRVPMSERLYVYKRGGEPCRRCGTLITWAEIGGRRTWWCPRCQP
jgi:formamidopyrimidine-DNA glycosylase